MHPLKAYRKARKIPLHDVAKATQLSKASLSRIEAYKQSPSRPSLDRLIKYAGGLLTPNDFFGAGPSGQ
jgi:transcriptional regulator with XRE-family HTH domain